MERNEVWNPWWREKSGGALMTEDEQHAFWEESDRCVMSRIKHHPEHAEVLLRQWPQCLLTRREIARVRGFAYHGRETLRGCDVE